MMYESLAFVYDRLMNDVDYSKWVDYIEEIFKSNGAAPKLVLDLGCGTGSFCINMAKRGYEMIGLDISTEMLSCARFKSEEREMDILYLNQDMTDFELYGTVDAITCLMDSVNYVSYKNDLKRMFKLVKNYLNAGGLFIFDINTEYKLREILGNNVFYSVDEDVAYIWENKYDTRRNVCEFDLTFFVKNGNMYKRYDEIHLERAYTIDEIIKVVNSSGMSLEGIYDSLSFNPPCEKSERIFFVCKKTS